MGLKHNRDFRMFFIFFYFPKHINCNKFYFFILKFLKSKIQIVAFFFKIEMDIQLFSLAV